MSPNASDPGVGSSTQAPATQDEHGSQNIIDPKAQVQLPLTAVEWQAFEQCLMKTSPPNQLFCAYIMRLTGLHPGVVVRLRASYVDFEAACLHIPGEVLKHPRSKQIPPDLVVNLGADDFQYLCQVRDHGLPDAHEMKTVGGGLLRRPYAWPTTENGFLFPSSTAYFADQRVATALAKRSPKSLSPKQREAIKVAASKAPPTGRNATTKAAKPAAEHMSKEVIQTALSKACQAMFEQGFVRFQKGLSSRVLFGSTKSAQYTRATSQTNTPAAPTSDTSQANTPAASKAPPYRTPPSFAPGLERQFFPPRENCGEDLCWVNVLSHLVMAAKPLREALLRLPFPDAAEELAVVDLEDQGAGAVPPGRIQREFLTAFRVFATHIEGKNSIASRDASMLTVLATLPTFHDIQHDGQRDVDEVLLQFLNQLLVLFPSLYDLFSIRQIEERACQGKGGQCVYVNITGTTRTVQLSVNVDDLAHTSNLFRTTERSPFDCSLCRGCGEEGNEMTVTRRYEPLGDLLIVVLRSTAFAPGAAAGAGTFHSFVPSELLTCDHETPQLRFRQVFTALRSGVSANSGHWVGVVKSCDHMYGVLNDSSVAWRRHSPLLANPVFVNDTGMNQSIVVYVRDSAVAPSPPAPSLPSHPGGTPLTPSPTAPSPAAALQDEPDSGPRVWGCALEGSTFDLEDRVASLESETCAFLDDLSDTFFKEHRAVTHRDVPLLYKDTFGMLCLELMDIITSPSSVRVRKRAESLLVLLPRLLLWAPTRSTLTTVVKYEGEVCKMVAFRRRFAKARCG
jgi:hypothetical protein